MHQEENMMKKMTKAALLAAALAFTAGLAGCFVSAVEDDGAGSAGGGSGNNSFLTTSIDTSTTYKAGGEIVSNDALTATATVAMKGAAVSGVSFTDMNGNTVSPTVGIQLSSAMAANATTDDIFTVTAKEDIAVNIYVVWSNNSFNSHKKGDVFYSVNGGAKTTKSIEKRTEIWTIAKTLSSGEVLTVGATNTDTSDGKLWLFGVEAKKQ